MQRIKRYGGQSRHGFTLVEIMIVVATIGLLATLAIPSFVKARRTSITTKCVLNQRSIFDAVTRYEMDFNTTLFSMRSNGVQIRNTLLAGGYMNPQNNFDCPASQLKDFDDYLLVYSNGTDLVGISCTIDTAGHVLPP